MRQQEEVLDSYNTFFIVVGKHLFNKNILYLLLYNLINIERRGFDLEYLYNKNRDDNGNHEVHNYKCDHSPNNLNRVELGQFSSCEQAIAFARNMFGRDNFDGCKHCCPECHKG